MSTCEAPDLSETSSCSKCLFLCRVCECVYIFLLIGFTCSSAREAVQNLPWAGVFGCGAEGDHAGVPYGAYQPKWAEGREGHWKNQEHFHCNMTVSIVLHKQWKI